jgi:hypothetical protein
MPTNVDLTQETIRNEHMKLKVNRAPGIDKIVARLKLVSNANRFSQ